MLSKFCSICGKDGLELICGDCSNVEETKKPVKIKKCLACSRTYHKNKQVFEEFVEKHSNINWIDFNCLECKPKRALAIIQLRGDIEPRIPYDFKESVKQVKTLKEGHDIEFTDPKEAFKFSKYLRNRYDVYYKLTRKLLTQRKDGKRIYQPTILLRLKEE